MDGMFSSLLSPVLNAIYPVGIEEIRNSKQKELRIIDTVEPLLNQHRLVMDYSAIKRDLDYALAEPKNIYYSFIYQLTHITHERGALVHDDRLDGITLGLQYWNDYGILKQDSGIALEAFKKKQVEDELLRRGEIFKRLNNKSNGGLSVVKSRYKGFNNNLTK